MLQFDVPTKAKLIDVNPRSERHGDELVPAIDLRFQLDIGNHILATYHPELLEWLYHEAAQGQLPGVQPNAEKAALRFPQLGQPLHWKDESVGNALTIDYGIGGESNVTLAGGKVHKHVITAKEGGTVSVAFTYSAALPGTHDVSESAVGRLGTRVQHDVHILLSGGREADEPEGETA